MRRGMGLALQGGVAGLSALTGLGVMAVGAAQAAIAVLPADANPDMSKLAGTAAIAPLSDPLIPTPDLQLAQAQIPPRQTIPTPVLPKPTEPPQSPLLPPPERLFQLPPTPGLPQQQPLDIPGLITVKEFQVEGSTIFSQEKLAEVTRSYTGRSLSFAELLEAAAAITKLYTDQGYVTSGAYIPANQTFSAQDAVVKIAILEGSLEEIRVQGNERLFSSYVRSRLAIATRKPLNVNRLLAGLRLLQVNPLISTISADLSAGSSVGKSILTVTVTEAKAFVAGLSFDNSRSPSIGTDKKQIQFNHANLVGFGDSISLTANRTAGSDGLDVSYTAPFNPYNGTLRFAFSTSASKVIERPFDVLNITSAAESYELSLRQPLFQTPNREIAVGLTASHQTSSTALLGVPFPLVAGADDRGNLRISALRFFQEYTQRNSQSVLAFRSQFNFGLDLLGDTINQPNPFLPNVPVPDTRFVSWRGQGQYVRLLAPDTPLLVRGDLQFADRPLVTLEQFGLGGGQSVRGYRQDFLLADNGALASAEVRIPVFRIPQLNGTFRIVPFVDLGTVWNTNRATPSLNTLASAGIGVLWQMGNYLTIRLDWGIPLTDLPQNRPSTQENGLHFSIVVTPFTF